MQVSDINEIVSINSNSGSSDVTIKPSKAMIDVSTSSLERSVSDTEIQKGKVTLNTESSIREVDTSKGKGSKNNPNAVESYTTEKPKGNEFSNFKSMFQMLIILDLSQINFMTLCLFQI